MSSHGAAPTSPAPDRATTDARRVAALCGDSVRHHRDRGSACPATVSTTPCSCSCSSAGSGQLVVRLDGTNAGSGKTTHAREVERRPSAIRFSADDWLEERGLDLWNEDARDRIEQLQWQLAKRLVVVGVSVVIEWGTWYRAGRDRVRVRRSAWVLERVASPRRAKRGAVRARRASGPRGSLRSVASRLASGRRRSKPPRQTRPTLGWGPGSMASGCFTSD
jgi:hypothetical protein